MLEYESVFKYLRFEAKMIKKYENTLNEFLSNNMLIAINDMKADEDSKIKTIKHFGGIGGNWDIKDDKGRSLIFHATKNGELKVLNMLVEEADVNMRDSNNNGVLVYSKNEKVYDFWMQRGKDLDTSIGEYPLCVASEIGSLFMVEKLLEKEECIDEKDYNAYTPLMYAIDNGHKDVAKFLIEKGANIELRDAGGKTPLMLAILGKQFEIIDMLLDKGAELEAKDFEGWTALVYGATEGEFKSVDKLVEKGANVNHQTDYGETAVMLASGDIEMVKKLLERGADVNIKDFEDETVLSRVVSALVYDEKIVELLVQNGADVNVRDQVGRTPLMKVIKNYDYKFEVVKMLVENGAKIAVEDKWGDSPILLAIAKRKSDAEEYLKEKQGENPKVEVFYSFDKKERGF